MNSATYAERLIFMQIPGYEKIPAIVPVLSGIGEL